MNPIILSPESSAAENRRILQNAIDTTAASGGGVVTVPPGCYRTGGLQLRTGVTFRLSEGATLLGSDRVEDYDTHFIEHFSTPGGSRVYMALIYAEDCERIAIEGPGTMDGQGGAEAWRSYAIPGGKGAWHKPSALGYPPVEVPGCAPRRLPPPVHRRMGPPPLRL